ncbi:MAG: type II secretion system protein N [Parahaliea sp.]
MIRTASIAMLLGLLLLCLMLQAPARLLPALLPGQPFYLAGVSGTVWHGQASRAVLQTSAGPVALGRVEWWLNPWSLPMFSPVVTVNSQWGSQHLSARVQLHGDKDIGLEDVSATISAALLRQVAPLAVDGQFSLQVRYLRVRDGLPVAAEGRLVLEHGVWNAPRGRLPLGSYVLEVGPAPAGTALNEDAALSGQVTTLAGPVAAEGRVSLAGRDYRLDIRIGGDRPLDPMLQQGLSLMAQPVGNAYHLQLSGSL